MIAANTKIRVRYQETDAMGIVHHSNYIIWFEAARITLLDHIGLPYKEIEEMGFASPVVEVYCKYKKPAYFDDILEVIAEIREKPFVTMEVHYKVLRGETLLCTGHSKHAFLNKAGELIRPPAEFMEKVKPFFN